MERLDFKEPMKEGCYKTITLLLPIQDPPILRGWMLSESLPQSGTVLPACLLLRGSATHSQD